MGKTIGIDLGTTNSCMAVTEGGESKVIANAEGSRVTPSVVAFTKDGERLVGEVAKRQAVTNPERTIASIKRKIGTKETIDIDGKKYKPQEISAMIIQKLKADAESYLGQTVDRAVVTVPAYFDDAQRTATKEAGEIAGLKVLRIINEPTAASLAYGLGEEKEQTILVYDLGGGTFDVSILEIEPPSKEEKDLVVQVTATHGDTQLGGDDWDQRIINWMADDFKNKHGIDLRQDKMALQRLKETAEKAKIELSSTTSTNINLPFVTATDKGPLHLEMTLSRAEFNKMTADLVEKCVEPFNQAIADAGVKVSDIDHVILVGGSTRMPAIHDLVKKLTGGKEPHQGVNPDEVVAVGAAIQAGHLAGEVKGDILLVDVTPLSLGIETKGGVFTGLIERNTSIPIKKSEIFTTAEDNQTSVEVHVLQGERPMAAYNKTLGKFHLIGVPPAPRGVPQIEVAFDIDANGIVNVSAKDLGTGKEQKITITGSSALSEEDIKRMQKEAEAHAEEDRKKKEEADIKNNADTLVHQTEKSLQEVGDKLNQTDKANIEAAVKEVKEALKGDDVEKIKTTTEALMQASHKLAETLYASQAQSQAGGAQAGPEPGTQQQQTGKDSVVDAEVVEEDEKEADEKEDEGKEQAK